MWLLHVRHVVVGDPRHDLANRVAFSNVGQELVAQTCYLRRALDHARDVDERVTGAGTIFSEAYTFASSANR